MCNFSLPHDPATRWGCERTRSLTPKITFIASKTDKLLYIKRVYANYLLVGLLTDIETFSSSDSNNITVLYTYRCVHRCKRVALVPMLTDVARLQSVLEFKTGSRILPNGSRSQIQN